MAKSITITVPHALGREQAQRRIAAEIDRLKIAYVDKFAYSDVQWMGDVANVRVVMLGQEVAGQLEIFEESVRIEVALPWILATLTSRVQGVITTTTQETLRLEDKTNKPS